MSDKLYRKIVCLIQNGKKNACLCLRDKQVYRDTVCAGDTWRHCTLKHSDWAKLAVGERQSETVEFTASPQSAAELFGQNKFGNEAAARLSLGYQNKFMLKDSLSPGMNWCRTAWQWQQMKVWALKESVLVHTWECDEDWLTFVTSELFHFNKTNQTH
jgi:hypothetical protein